MNQGTRKLFPILNRRVHGRQLVYLDNAATTQKPRPVLEAERRYYETTNANVHRAIHTLGEEATAMLESSRETVARFINAADPSEVVFVRNATEALNVVACGLAPLVKTRDTVAVSLMEHHANFLPWQRLAVEQRARFAVAPLTAQGALDLPKLRKLFATERIRVLALTHVSNVLGTINPIAAIAKLCRKYGTILVVDGAQAVGHMPVDVQKLGCDFYAFSGHKMYGPMGIGVLWGRAELLDRMEPMLVGGEMVKTIPTQQTKAKSPRHPESLSEVEGRRISRFFGRGPQNDGVEYAPPLWNDLPWKFEAGTPNVAGAAGLAEACRFLDRIGRSNIRKHAIALTRFALKGLAAIPGVTIFGPLRAEDRGGLVAFSIAGIHPHDISQLLDEQGIAVRSGHHCAEPLHRALGIAATTRVSFGAHNTVVEVRAFLSALRRSIRTFLKKQPVIASEAKQSRGAETKERAKQAELTASVASETNMQSLLYRQELLDHAQNPRNYGAVKHPHFEAEDANVFCGDRIRITGTLTKNGKISGLRFEGEGCAISQAAASILTEYLTGKPLRAVAQMKPDTMLKLLNISLSPIRLKCGLLALTVVQKAHRGYTNSVPQIACRHCEARRAEAISRADNFV